MRDIANNLHKYGKKSGDKWELDLDEYKILGEGEVTHKLVIKAKEASQSAIEKVENAGGSIILSGKKEKIEKEG